tara:strand:+ start:19 stop:222 length:204 start_codon:yes stop_codon:yes gene_type:complete
MLMKMHLSHVFSIIRVLEHSLSKPKPWEHHRSDQVGPDVFVEGEVGEVEVECFTVLDDKGVYNNDEE